MMRRVMIGQKHTIRTFWNTPNKIAEERKVFVTNMDRTLYLLYRS